MPAIAAIALLNGESTPVSHTFAPLGQDLKTGIWWFEDQSPRVNIGSSLGYPRIGIRTKREIETKAGSSSKTTVSRVELTVALPQLESLGTGSNGFLPAPTVAYVDRYKGEFLLSSRNTIADRKDLAAYAKNLTGHVTVVSLIESLASMY